MKWKAGGCLILAAAVIVTAFYFPRALLYHQQETMMNRVETRPAEQLNINFYQQSNMEKLKIISSPTAWSSYMDNETENTEEILDILNRELKTLRELGICTHLLDFGDLQPIDVCAILPIMFIDGQKVLQVYDIDTVWGMFTIDAKTGKILKMSLMSRYSEIDIGGILTQWIQTDESYTHEFAQWAEYYGLTPGMVDKGKIDPEEIIDRHLLLYGSFSDDLGEQIGMVVYYSESMYNFEIESLSMDELTAHREEESLR